MENTYLGEGVHKLSRQCYQELYIVLIVTKQACLREILDLENI